MLDLPLADNSCSGVAALYSIIHFNTGERVRALSELSRILEPGGWLLISFHIEASGFAPGDVNHLKSFLGHPVEMDGYFLDPTTVIEDLTATGLRVTTRVDREPMPEIEFPSRRCYLLAQQPSQAAPPTDS
jgi:SAM-dependent methyltransferase